MQRRMSQLYLVLLLLLMIGPPASGLKTYQDRIPNGFRVPHPCFLNFIWNGVGHRNHEGGGTLNPFGQDFKANNFQWGPTVCQKDSDGDGKTNGEELGDPDCEWFEGEMPKQVSGLSHPGICEPLDDPVCQDANDWQPEVCTPIVYDCPAIEDPATTPLPLRFDNISVEAKETAYWCQAVEFPKDRDYHMFSMQPIVDNAYVVHHIDMYECPDEQADWALGEYPNAKPCGAMEGCSGNMIAAWALGIVGICLGDSHGIRVGETAAKVAIMRIHYHNPEELENQHDTSGLLMHYTTDMRPYDCQVLNLGQMYLEVPPQLPSIKDEISCGPFCTNTWQSEIKIILGTVHMHFLGKSTVTELWRDGQFVKEVFRQNNYDYNQPIMVSFEDDPIILKPGDTLRHVCEFQSVERTELVYRGQSAFDEMCHVYFVYYPAQNLTECFNEGQVETCKYQFTNGRVKDVPENCDEADFNKQYAEWMEDHLTASCDDTGKECLPNCEEAVANVTASHGCMEDNTLAYMKRIKGGAFRNMLNSCVVWPTAPPAAPQTTHDSNGNQATRVSAAHMATVTAIFLFVRLFV